MTTPTKAKPKKSPRKPKFNFSKLNGILERAVITNEGGKALIVLVIVHDGKRALYKGPATQKALSGLMSFVGVVDFNEIGHDKISFNFDGKQIVELFDRKNTCSFKF